MTRLARDVAVVFVGMVVSGAGLSSCDGDGDERGENAPAEELVVDSAAADDGALTDALSAVSLDDDQFLRIEVPAAARAYGFLAELPPDWTVSATTSEETKLDTDAWELVGPQGEAITIMVYDARNTSYSDPAPAAEDDFTEYDHAWRVLEDFTVDQIGPSSEFLIGNTEEVEFVRWHSGGDPRTRKFVGFDLTLVDATEVDQEASRLVLSLDGSFFITFTTPFAVDPDTASAVGAAYELILDTAVGFAAAPQ